MKSAANILDIIIAEKHREVAIAKMKVPLKDLEQTIVSSSLENNRGFIKAIQQSLNHQTSAIIAEIKKASPSKGVIREHYDPIAIAKSYANAGATCLSVLTDEKFFQGSAIHLRQAHNACKLPILRKDFIIDPYQVFETKAMNADCLLLIVAALTQDQLLSLNELAVELNLDVLIEVHDQIELERALQLDNILIGINNRNLKTFEISLNNTLDLLPLIPANRIIVTESGIHTTADVALMRKNHVNCFLVGEAMMQADDPGAKLKSLFGIYS